MAVMPFQTQNVQPLFPQPQGNVYNINSTLEVANVPKPQIALGMKHIVNFLNLQEEKELLFPRLSF